MRVQQMAQSFSEDERIRAGNFYFKRDRKRFIVGRGVLRIILGRYLHIEPNRVQFSYGPHGKPYLAERHSDGALRFNLAHSHEFAIYGFTRGREIGVDLEYFRTFVTN
jgi:4'-phosphopantetheinyl transferase